MLNTERKMEIEQYRKLEKLLEPLLQKPDLKRVLAEFTPELSQSEENEYMSQAQDSATAGYGSIAVRNVNRYQRAVQKCSRVLDASTMALDSAEAVYGAALRRMGHDTAGITPSSFEVIFDNLAKPGDARPLGHLTSRDRAQIEARFPQIAKSLSTVKQL